MLKKMVCTVLALAVFLLVTGVFVGRLRQILPKTMLRQDQSLTYTRPEAAAQETEPAETEAPETLPPQTEPVETEPVAERFYYDAVPRYDQTAYPDILYRSGTIATSGSNITSLAMVASYLTGHEYLPDSLADYFADYIGNSMQWLEYASDQLQLPWWRAGNIDETIQYLREGKLAIVLMNEQSVFMEGQHFVVFTGITSDGKILVQDPYGPNYTAWNLENALIMAAAQFEAALKAVQADAKQNGAGNMADGFRAKNLQSLAGAIKTAVDTRMLISGIMTAAEKEKLQIEREKLAMEKRREEREMAEMEGAENNEIHIVIEKDDGEEINVEDLMG